MTAELTIYRCYWPQAYSYLNKFQINNFKAEAFGLLMTIDIEPKQAKRIASILPIGAVVDLVQLEDIELFGDLEIDSIDLENNAIKSLKTLKN